MHQLAPMSSPVKAADQTSVNTSSHVLGTNPCRLEALAISEATVLRLLVPDINKSACSGDFMVVGVCRSGLRFGLRLNLGGSIQPDLDYLQLGGRGQGRGWAEKATWGNGMVGKQAGHHGFCLQFRVLRL